MGENYEILKTNLQPFFWKKVKDTIRQNKKSALQEFLFGKYEEINPDNKGSNPIHSVHTSCLSSCKNDKISGRISLNHSTSSV